MKLFYRVFFTGLLIFGVFYANGQEWKKPSEVGGNYSNESLHHVHFVNSDTGWAVGGRGTIMTTVDGGTNWVGQTSGTSSTLRSVHFVDGNKGWAVGFTGTILKTSDGGITWTEQSSGTSNILTSVHFVDENTGWAVGIIGTILKTTNGGDDWNSQISGTTNSLRSIFFVDADTGWAVGGGYQESTILKTTNGGTEWFEQTSGASNSLSSVHFVDDNTGWAVGGDGTILKTSNGGSTWTEQSSGTSNSLTSVHFVDADTGWAVGASGTIRKTTNGGANWMGQTSGNSNSLRSVQFVDTNTGWAVGGFGEIWTTDDGGGSWIKQISGTSSDLRSVQFADTNKGWAVGSFGEIWTTDDGGGSWTAQNSGASGSLRSVHFVDEYTGWAVGNSGNLVKTTNGGNNWFEQNCGSTSIIYSGYFVDEYNGWVVLSNGTIFYTFNGGSTWTSQSSGTSNSLRSVHFADYSGWAVGHNGTILKNNSSGSTWTTQSSGTSNNLYSVHFVNDSTGWAVGSGATILSTTDGGSTWESQTSGTLSWLQSVHFVDENTGWAVGGNGTILKTTNGGTEWTEQSSGTSNTLFSVHFVDENTGWAVGQNGTILLYFPCSDASLFRTSGFFSGNQTVCLNSPIDDITYEVEGDPTGTDVNGLPAGVNSSFSAGVLTISGTPTESGVFNYTVTTTGTPSPCLEDGATGVIEVNENTAASASNDGPYFEGETINLSASGGVSYLWGGPDGFSSTEQNPSISNAEAVNGGIYSVTVTDENGCTDMATTEVEVDENPTISGLFQRGNGEPLPGVVVNYSGDESGVMSTDSDGFYEFTVDSGASIEVEAERNTSWVEFVSTLDLINIQRHILLIELLDSPYKIIAADANGDDNLSTIDLILLQGIILGMQDSIVGNKSWRFVPADYVFTDPTDPLSEDFPEEMEYDSLLSDQTDQDWVAIKVGDVTWPSSGIRTANEPKAVFYTSSPTHDNSGLQSIAIHAGKTDTWSKGYQFELHFDPNHTQIRDIQFDNASLPNLSENNFLVDNESGVLRANWYFGPGFWIEADSELFKLEFSTSRARSAFADLFEISPPGSRLNAEFYMNSKHSSRLLIQPLLTDREKTVLSHGVVPNPWSSAAELEFELSESVEAEIEVFTPEGRLVRTFTVAGHKGSNRFALDEQIPSGFLIYSINAGDQTVFGNMIRME